MAVIFNGKEIIDLTMNNANIDTGYFNNNEVFSSGKMVTYIVDTGKEYQEIVKKGQTCLSPKTFTPSKTDWTFVGWREDKTASGSVLTNKVMGDTLVTLYAVFKQVHTLTLYNNSTTATKKTGTVYYNNGNVYNDTSYVLSQTSRSGWTAKGWSTSAEANGGIVYTNNATIPVNENLTLYGRYDQNVTLSYWDGTKTVTQTHTRLYNSSGKTFNPTVAIWQVAVSGWNHIGFTTSTAANGGITNANGAVITMDGNKTFYARYNRTLTCRFDGGGATGGGTATASGVQDRGANGAITSVRITMPQCGYSRSDHSFRGWSYGSQVLQPGSAITITESTYATATWLQSVYRYNNAGNFAQVLTCPISANYRMEVWGAKGDGASDGTAGGLGGYAIGTQYLPAGTVLYIVCGGAGYGSTGGYNGGGNGGTVEANGGGGGATHIGLHNTTLAGYGNTNGLYIVAGGGGGGGSTHLAQAICKGGSGGGTNGEIGFNYLGEQKPDSGSGVGGSQTSGGHYGGTFGQGGHAYDQFSGGGGGGGLYGGGAGANYNGGAGGGGGSGYIGGVTGGSMAHWQNNGAGRAVITIL